MTLPPHPRRFLVLSATLALILGLALVRAGEPLPEPVRKVALKEGTFWQVDDIRPGMKGTGKTVMKGTRIETFSVEVLGVLKNSSPGRDMVLCRLSGLDLERTGIIAGMSGSPVYIDGKLLGAVAYGWSGGKDPIGGITPFVQMHEFVEAYERRDTAERSEPRRIGLADPLRLDGKEYDAVSVAQDFGEPSAREDEFVMRPLRTPLSATGFSANALRIFNERMGRQMGLVPMQGGGVSGKVASDEKDIPLEAGGSLALSLVTGDFDLSGIGTVTHIEGQRVYGWGHPFMSLGPCEFPLMTGYVHTVYPRQTVSFKMGSPLKQVGIINADVSTCIAGWLGKGVEMMPMKVRVALGKNPSRTFNVQVVRQKQMLPNLVFTVLTNCIDMEGDLPDETTAQLTLRIEVEDREPIIIQDVYSGMSGARAPQTLFSQAGTVVQMLTGNVFRSLKPTRIEADVQILNGRTTAEIETIETDADVYAPGDTVKVHTTLKPFKGARQLVTASLKLPADLPEGTYTLSVFDDVANMRLALRDNPTLNMPTTVDQLYQAIQAQTKTRRTNLVLRLPLGASGVAVDGRALPELPGSMVHILGNGRRSGAQTISDAVVSRLPTEWVIQGSESVKITVGKTRGVSRN
jgi:hypothetical protein